MGVPKFYRWISERYPCLSEIVKEHQISEFDNLYLDMNGIIHVVSHPDDSNPHFRITEEKIFRDVFHYIDVLFRLIKPRKVFFMAIDGVAPRAKMNQQRGRRFRSAREAEELIAKALSRGETLPSEDRFDSNCITPGTPFMVRLQEQLKYFVTDRVSNNALWQGPRIYLSGHETPGEGEHKIMDFIRSERANPNHDPNTRHCLYGLDADLMMLGLTSHEPHFSLLREEVRFGGKDSQKRSTTPEDTTFHLLHLSLMREYIDFEFSCLKTTLPFPYDLERIIDDWILMGFLVGNDFIPHLPNLHIDQDGLPLLWGVYMNILPSLDGYLNEDGKINLERFEKFMAELAKSDMEKFSDNYADLKWFAAKTGGKGMKNKQKGSPERKKFNMRKAQELYKKANKFELPFEVDDPEALMYDPISDDEDEDEAFPMTDADAALANGCVSEESQDQLMMDEFKHHKRGYYMEKLHVECVTLDFLQDQALQYVRALQWILYYYFDGCPSWSWFFPFHYAPYISDIHSFSHVDITFDLGKPFLPFQQLMAVLPAASRKLLPPAYRPLMTEDTSPIVDFYPTEFETDLNGKRQEWEAVVLIPFIEEKRLLAAMASKESMLTLEEKSRNVHGPCRLYQHASCPQAPFPSSLPGVFPDILVNYAKCTEQDMWEFVIPRAMLKRGLFDGVLLDVHFPGFPTFKHLPHRSSLKKANVKVFQSNSRGENMIVSVDKSNMDRNLNQIAQKLLDKTVFVRWPHLMEARVEAVSDGCRKISVARPKDGKKDSAGGVVWEKKDLNEFEQNKFFLDRESLMEQSYGRRGVQLGQVEILVYVQALQGRRYICGPQGNITLDKQYGLQYEYYALQTIVTDLRSHNPGFQQFTTVHELYPPDCDVFMVGRHAYGAQGKVLDIQDEGRIRVKLRIKQEPDLADIQYKKDTLSLQYMPAWMVAQKLSISAHLVSRITGCFRVANGQGDQTVNIGLNLKSNAKEEEVPGYTRKDNGQWLYSTKVVQLLDLYMKTWPTVFEVISKKTESDIAMDELFPESGGKTINDLTKFVKSLDCTSVPRVSHGCLLVDEPVISLIEKQLVTINEENKKSKKYQTIQVRPHLLYRPIVGNDVVADSSSVYRLFDRVVNVRIGFSVPLGLRGTIIGIYPGERDIDCMYEVLFDEEFVDALRIRCSGNRAYRMYGISLINISHGDRKTRPVQTAPPVKNKNNSNARKTATNGNSAHVGKRKDENEFNDIWNDLKVSKSPRKLTQQNQDGYDGSYSKCLKKDKLTTKTTEEAASSATVYNGKLTVIKRNKSVNKSSSRQITPVEWKKPEKENGIESLDAAASALASVQQPTKAEMIPKSDDSKSKPKEEAVDCQFAALMSCLELSNDGMRHGPGEPGVAQPVYGKKVSVEELFKVAHKESENVPELQPQNAANSALLDLEAWARNHGLPPPQYQYSEDGPSHVKASVLLGSQRRFQSSSVKTKDQAAQSAAAIALRELNQAGTGPRPSSAFRPVRPAPVQGPNHVVRPIHPLQGVPLWQQQQMFRPNMVDPRLLAAQNMMLMSRLSQQTQNPINIAYLQLQQRAQLQQQHQQQKLARPSPQIYQPPGARHGQTSNYQVPPPVLSGSQAPQPPHTACPGVSVSRPDLLGSTGTPSSQPQASSTGDMTSSRKRADSTSGNPFVPLQVARQQKTPQKKSESVEREDEKARSEPAAQHPESLSDTKNTPNDGAHDENKPKKTKKKASRRMAANLTLA